MSWVLHAPNSPPPYQSIFIESEPDPYYGKDRPVYENIPVVAQSTWVNIQRSPQSEDENKK